MDASVVQPLRLKTEAYRPITGRRGEDHRNFDRTYRWSASDPGAEHGCARRLADPRDHHVHVLNRVRRRPGAALRV
jgi:hypothetical protein